MNKPHSHNLRKGRRSLANHVYLVTTVTFDRKPLFTDPGNARVVIAALKHADANAWAKTLAYVLMPDHLHWLLELGESRSLAQLLHSIKSYSALRISGKSRQRIWQDGYHDHAVRTDEDLKALARYVVANPLRAGLVESIGDYPWWDAVWLDGNSSLE